MDMKRNKKTDISVVMYFVKKNIFTQKVRGLFFLCFFGVVSVMSFIFISLIYASKDDSLTKKYNNRVYAKTDKVIDAVNELDKKYQAVSTYRMSLDGYDNDKVSERLATLGIAFMVLLFVAILEVVILDAVMKIKIKDWQTFRQLGMKAGMIKKINMVEMLIYCMAAVVITVVYIIYLLYNIVVCMITSKRFCSTIMKIKIKERKSKTWKQE